MLGALDTEVEQFARGGMGGFMVKVFALPICHIPSHLAAQV